MLNPNIYDNIIIASWQLAEDGIESLTNGKIAEKAGLYEVEVNALFPEKKYILLALLADLRAKTVLADYNPNLPGDEQFFDAIMSYYDTAKPYKTAIKKIFQDLLWNPILALNLTPSFQQLSNELVDRYYPAPEETSPFKLMGRQLIQRMAYQTLLLRVFYLWLEDDTFDASKTMVALDKGIKQISECKTWF